MRKNQCSRRAALGYSALLFVFLGVGAIYLQRFWPHCLLVIGAPLALRQYLLGRRYDAEMTLLLFSGAFISLGYDIPWHILLPTLFSIGSCYVFLRECIEITSETEEEREAEILEELEEDQTVHSEVRSSNTSK